MGVHTTDVFMIGVSICSLYLSFATSVYLSEDDISLPNPDLPVVEHGLSFLISMWSSSSVHDGITTYLALSSVCINCDFPPLLPTPYMDSTWLLEFFGLAFLVFVQFF